MNEPSVENILADGQSGSPFSRYIGDVTPIQQRVAHDYVVRIRAAMARIMKEQGISFDEARCGSRCAANTTLLYAAISVDELHPDRLRGYGQVSDAGQSLLMAIIAELHSLIGKFQAQERCLAYSLTPNDQDMLSLSVKEPELLDHFLPSVKRKALIHC